MKLLEAAGLPPGVINFVPGDAGDDHRRSLLDSPRPRRHPLHRQHRRLQRACGRRSARNIGRYRSLPAPRRRDRRQGLHRRAPLGRRRRRSRWRSCAAASSTRARSARPPAASTCRSSLWNDVRDRHRRDDATSIKMGDVARLPQLHGRGHRQEGRSTRSAATSTDAQQAAPTILHGRRGATARRATSSSRRWSRPTIPATACCARRSSARW